MRSGRWWSDSVVVAVVVTHHPSPEATSRLLDAIAPQVDRIIVVDNGSPAAAVQTLREQLAAHDGELHEQPLNCGLAAAQNLGMDRARLLGASHIFLSDQDSLPAPDMVTHPLRGLDRLREAGRRIAAVGPITTDDRAPGQPLLFLGGPWRARQSGGPANA